MCINLVLFKVKHGKAMQDLKSSWQWL